MYAFIHFGINTFTDREWGHGDESEKLFDPTDFDADQIVSSLKAGGMTGVVLTCKHHDGFCLWPSACTEHSVKNSPYKGGKGDIVREISDACHRQGLAFGVYISPWDRNHAEYGRPEYVEYYRKQLTELLTNYGPIFEVWHDGANGGTGYYGGANEARKIDKLTYYHWPATYELVRRLQPEAAIFSDGGPDCRWVGNEIGEAGETCWATMSTPTFPGQADEKILTSGERPGKKWLPAEVDVSIRPGWFYHEKEDAKVKSADQLFEIYFKSVGRGANLILNVPPNRQGRIAPQDVASLAEFKKRVDAAFATDLAKGATVTASNTRGNDPAYAASHLVGGDRNAYWSTDDAVTTPSATLTFAAPVTFNTVAVREFLPLGQRVDSIAVDAWDAGKNDWREIATATSIGNLRLIRLPADVTATQVRLRVTGAAACPAISGVSLYEVR
jgi:alpha-L-fucosidase